MPRGRFYWPPWLKEIKFHFNQLGDAHLDLTGEIRRLMLASLADGSDSAAQLLKRALLHAASTEEGMALLVPHVNAGAAVMVLHTCVLDQCLMLNNVCRLFTCLRLPALLGDGAERLITSWLHPRSRPNHVLVTSLLHADRVQGYDACRSLCASRASRRRRCSCGGRLSCPHGAA